MKHRCLSRVLAVLIAAGTAWASGSQGISEDLARRLADAQAPKRQAALRELPELGTLEAWGHVLDALKDPEPRVADEAEMALAKLTPGAAAAPGKLLDLVMGKTGFGSRDDWVRLRVACAIGDGALSLDSSAWERMLGDKEPGIRRAACYSAERMARAGRLGPEKTVLARTLEKLAQSDKHSAVKAAALCALGALDAAGSPKRIETALQSSEPAVRCAGLLCIQAAATEQHQASLSQGLQDSEFSVRNVALEVWAQTPSARAASEFVQRLTQESNLRLRWKIVEVLREWSGLRYGLDPRPWSEWSGGLAPDWKPAAQATKGMDDEDRSQILGLPIRSERLVILVDFSGSVWKKDAAGRTVKARLDEELKRTLESFSESTQFNLIPYTAKPIPWAARLCPATPAAIAKALDFFADRKDQGQGDFWTALELALEDPNVDTIVMLGDGAPSGGKRWNLDLMAERFSQANRFRQVSLDAVLIGSKGALTGKWVKLCSAGRGRVLQVD